MARKLRYIDGADFLGPELAASVELVWEEATRYNRDVFGTSSFSKKELGRPVDRISIHETEMPHKSGVEAVFTWPDGDFLAGGTGHDEDEALYLLMEAMEKEHSPHEGHQMRPNFFRKKPKAPPTAAELEAASLAKLRNSQVWKDKFRYYKISEGRSVKDAEALADESTEEYWARKRAAEGKDVAFMRNGKRGRTMRRNSGLSLYANPYDNSAGFYFSTWEDFEKKYTAKYKKSGTEEYEIEFIDGDPLEQKLFNVMTLGVDTSNLGAYFMLVEELHALDDDQKVGMLWLMEDRLVEVDQALQKAENVAVFEGTPEDYAESLIDDMGEIPSDLSEMYFDYDSFGRDLRISGDDIMSTEEEIENLSGGDEDDQEEAERLQEWVDNIEGMDDDDRAHEFIDSIGGLEEAVSPEQLARYFDYEAWARDMGFNGEIDTFHLDGTDYVITNASEH